MAFQNALRLLMPWMTPGEDAQISSLIERLSYLVAEGERISGRNQGLDVWGQKVRVSLETAAPEFLAEWDAAETDARLEFARAIMRELRGRF
jgi:hypothetical protein